MVASSWAEPDLRFYFQDEMTKFHSDDYIRFLRSIRPDNMGEYSKLLQRFNVGEDCPVFDGLYEFCQLSCGGSVASAVKLNKQVRRALSQSVQSVQSVQSPQHPTAGCRHRCQLGWWTSPR